MPTAAPSAQRLFRTLCYASLIVAAACSDQSEPLAPRMTVTPHAVVTPDIVVTSTADNGPGTLRDAVLNATPGQVIGFDASIAGQTITLSSFIGVHLGAVLTIDGGPAGMTISGGSATQIFIVQFNSTVTLRNLTLENAATSTGGGAVVNAGTLTIENSTLRNNFALAGGGALYNVSTTANARLVNTTLSENSGSYAAIYSTQGAQLALINTTVSGSTSLYSGSSLQLAGAGPTVLENSILTVGPNRLNCYLDPSTITTVGLNIVNDASCGTGAGFMIADPLLLPLADNGGPTQTLALDRLSLAIDAATSCSTTEDQRHFPRPLGTSCDVGAVEFDKFSTFGLTVDGSVTVNPKTGVAVVTGTLSCSEPTATTLDVTLRQKVKVKRVSAVVQALAHVTIQCAGPAAAWSAAMAPVSGAFENGTGTAAAVTSSHVPYFLATSKSTAVRMYWGHK